MAGRANLTQDPIHGKQPIGHFLQFLLDCMYGLVNPRGTHRIASCHPKHAFRNFRGNSQGPPLRWSEAFSTYLHGGFPTRGFRDNRLARHPLIRTGIMDINSARPERSTPLRAGDPRAPRHHSHFSWNNDRMDFPSSSNEDSHGAPAHRPVYPPHRRRRICVPGTWIALS